MAATTPARTTTTATQSTTSIIAAEAHRNTCGCTIALVLPMTSHVIGGGRGHRSSTDAAWGTHATMPAQNGDGVSRKPAGVAAKDRTPGVSASDLEAAAARAAAILQEELDRPVGCVYLGQARGPAQWMVWYCYFHLFSMGAIIFVSPGGESGGEGGRGSKNLTGKIVNSTGRITEQL